MKLPPVANYLRINLDPTKKIGSDTFAKGDKHQIDKSHLEKCSNLANDINYQTKVIKAIENTKFEEIFDPENFQENSNLSLYMGLSNSLSDRKSIMLLTYGYSGVGKTFTLFGDGKGNAGLLNSDKKSS
jgi:hypothetical protein